MWTDSHGGTHFLSPRVHPHPHNPTTEYSGRHQFAARAVRSFREAARAPRRIHSQDHVYHFQSTEKVRACWFPCFGKFRWNVPLFRAVFNCLCAFVCSNSNDDNVGGNNSEKPLSHSELKAQALHELKGLKWKMHNDTHLFWNFQFGFLWHLNFLC